MRLSPRDPRIGQWHNFMADAELGLGHFDSAIDEANARRSTPVGAFGTPTSISPPRTR